MELSHGAYLISDDPALLDVSAIHGYLVRSYWCADIPRPTLERAIANSLCVGAYRDGAQVGLVRCVSDFATFCYVCDVYVLEAHRGHGLAKAMMAAATGHPRLQGLRRWNLVTRDAHGLYGQTGFTAIAHPERYMEKLDRQVYQSKPAP